MVAADCATFWRDQAGRVPLLTTDEELHLGRLVRKWQDWPGGPEAAPPNVQRSGRKARDRMVSANLRLVISYVGKKIYHLGEHVTQADFPDILQQCAIGLTTGANKYDPERGYKFSTYAYWWVRQAAARWRDDNSRAIRLPQNKAILSARAMAMRELLAKQLGRSPSAAELAAALEIDVKVIEVLLAVGPCPISLDAQCRNADSEITLVEMITAPTLEPRDPLIDELPNLLARLNERSRSLLVLYYGLGEGKAMSFAQIGKKMNLSRSRVSQLIAVANQELRREVEA
jgi:RNA polymerase primary sigma factor